MIKNSEKEAMTLKRNMSQPIIKNSKTKDKSGLVISKPKLQIKPQLDAEYKIDLNLIPLE